MLSREIEVTEDLFLLKSIYFCMQITEVFFFEF